MMKEYEKRIKYNGIKPSLVGEDSNYLEECYGLIPTKDGLRAYSPIQLFEGSQYFKAEDCYIVLRNLACLLYSSAGTLLEILPYATEERLSFVDYQDYRLLGNGSFFATIQDNKFNEYRKATIPLATCYADFNGQLFAGGVLSDWHGCGSDSVTWAAVRTDNFEAFPEAGWIHLTNNNILWLKQIGTRMMVYGSSYISSLVPFETSFGEKPVFSFGLANPYAVDGDTTVHVFVDTLGCVWRYSHNGEYVKLDYSHLFKSFVSEVRVIYRSQFDDFYITVPSLGRSYVLTTEGLGEANQVVLACSGFIGTGTQSPSDKFKILTTRFMFNQTSKNTLREIELQGEYQEATCQVVAHYIKYKTNLRTIPLTHSHTAVPLATANGFQVLFEGTLFPDIQIDSVLYRYFLSDRHHIRGASDVV